MALVPGERALATVGEPRRSKDPAQRADVDELARVHATFRRRDGASSQSAVAMQTGHDGLGWQLRQAPASATTRARATSSRVPSAAATHDSRADHLSGGGTQGEGRGRDAHGAVVAPRWRWLCASAARAAASRAAWSVGVMAAPSRRGAEGAQWGGDGEFIVLEWLGNVGVIALSSRVPSQRASPSSCHSR